MSARERLALGVALSALWAAAFVVGVARGALYSWLPPIAGLALALSLWAWPSATSPWRGLAPSTLLKDVAAGGLLGAALVVATHGGFTLLGGVLPGLVDDVDRLYGVAAVTPGRLAFVVLVAATEEVLWRGLVQDAIAELVPGATASTRRASLAAAAAAAVYAASQIGPQSAWLLVAALGLGGLWGLVRVWTGRLTASLVAHLVWTLSVLGAVPLR